MAASKFFRNLNFAIWPLLIVGCVSVVICLARNYWKAKLLLLARSAGIMNIAAAKVNLDFPKIYINLFMHSP